jgi:hypothetical protein
MITRKTNRTRNARRAPSDTLFDLGEAADAGSAAVSERAPENLVKVNSAQINSIRMRYQDQARASARPASPTRTRTIPPKPQAPSRPARAGVLTAVEKSFRRLAIELGLERVRELLAEVEGALDTTGSG